MTLKLRTKVVFPPTVQGGNGITVSKANGIWTVAADVNSIVSQAAQGLLLDEDDMASNSATKAPTQQSTKAYFDAPQVANRAALAALSGAVHPVAYMREAGREGNFKWDSSDLSAKVTVDTAQGLFVAPASDATGASGAWRRICNGAINSKWFGAVGDGTSHLLSELFATLGAAQAAYPFATSLDQTLDWAGIQSAILYSEAASCPTVHVPAGLYKIGSDTIRCRKGVPVVGEGINPWPDYPTFGTTLPSATAIQYDGTGIAVDVYPDADGASAPGIFGGGWRGLEIQSRNGTHCIRARSQLGAEYELYCLGGLTASMETGVLAAGSIAPPNDFSNNFIRLHAQNFWGAAIIMDGDVNANSCTNSVYVHALYRDKSCVVLKNCDSNRFQMLRLFNAGSVAGVYGVELHGGATATEMCRGNTFGLYQPGSGGTKVFGTADYTVAATDNLITEWNTENNFGGAANITVGTGADLTVVESNRTRRIEAASTYQIDFDAWQSYTPTVTSGTGTLTTVSLQQGKYKLVGKTCHFWAKCTVTTNGTGSQDLRFTLPITPLDDSNIAIHGYNISTAAGIHGLIASGLAVTRKYDGTYPVADGQAIRIFGTYEVA